MATASSPSAEAHPLADQVHSLEHRVAQLESRQAALSAPELDQLWKLHEAVRALTEEIFGGAVNIEADCDAETDERYFRVDVASRGDAAQLLQLNDQWHRRIGDIAGDLALKFRLSLSFA